MRVLVDTNVLIAAFYDDHPHHESSHDLYIKLEKNTGMIAAHSLAETYSRLTGAPGKSRVSPEEAILYLGNIRERFHVVTLDETEYFGTIQKVSDANIMGGGIYDALIAACAIKAKAKILYTWNIWDFKRLSPEIAGLVRRPDEI